MIVYKILLRIIAVCIVGLMISGCASDHWATQWNKLPSSWRNENLSYMPPSGQETVVLVTGFQGYRYNQIGGIIYATLSRSSNSDIPEGKVESIHWITDPEECKGVAFKLEEDSIRLLLKTSRRFLRFMILSDEETILVNDLGSVIVKIPPVINGYDLDIQKEGSIPIKVCYARCVSVEARTLAVSEIERIRRDEEAGRIDHETAVQLQKNLAKLLASKDNLCTECVDH